MQPLLKPPRLYEKILIQLYYNRSRNLLLLLLTLLWCLVGLSLRWSRLGAGLVHLVEEVKGGVLELVGLLLELLRSDLTLTRLRLGDDLTESSDLLTDLVSLGLVKTVGELVESLLGIVHDRVGAVSGLNGSLALLISLSVLLRVVDHVLDLLVGETGAGSKGDRLVLAGGLVLGVDVDDGISIDVEGDLDLWNTAVRWWDTNKLEVSEQLVVTDELTLSLVDLDLDSGLVISGGGEDLGLLGWDGGVAVGERSHDTTSRLIPGESGATFKRSISLVLLEEVSSVRMAAWMAAP